MVLFFPRDDETQEHTMLLTSVCFGMEFCLYRHVYFFLSVFGGFVITWSPMIISVISDRLHLTFIWFFTTQQCHASCFSVLFLLEVTLFFLLCKRKLFLATVSRFFFFLQDIDNYCIYSDYTVKLKTYLILILYLLLSVFVCGTDLTGSKFLRLCVYQTIKWNNFKWTLVWVMSLKLMLNVL